MARTGKEFLHGLKDERQIWVGSERVRDVAGHPAFAGAARSVAALFDLQHEAADVCLMPESETGELVNVRHIIPRSHEDLVRRHGTPDHCSATVAEKAEAELNEFAIERGPG